MASALPPLAPSAGHMPPHFHMASGLGSQDQTETIERPPPIVAPPGQKRMRHIKSAAPRLASRQLSELGQRFHRALATGERHDQRPSAGSVYQTTGSTTSVDAGHLDITTASHRDRRRSSSSSSDMAPRPSSSQVRPSSAMKGSRMDRRRSISAPEALNQDGAGSQVELPRIRRDRVSSAMPRLTSGSGPGYRPNSLSLSRPTSASGRSRPSPTTAFQMFETLLEEEHDEMSEEAFLADLNDEEFEEWICAQERGDRAKIAALRRLLIIKKLGINTRDKGNDWRSGEIAIPEFHCEHCRNHWLRRHELPDECPEERRKRLAAEAESKRHRYGSARRKRKSKRSAKRGGGDDGDGSDYEEYVDEDGTVRRRLKAGRNGGRSDTDGVDGVDGGAGGGGQRGRRGGAGASETIAENDDDDDFDHHGNGGRGRNGGGITGGSSADGGTVGGGGGGGNSLGDEADGSGYGKGAFVGADGKVYTGGSVTGDFQLDGIPGYGKDKGKNRSLGGDGKENALSGSGGDFNLQSGGDPLGNSGKGRGRGGNAAAGGMGTSDSSGGLSALASSNAGGLGDPFGKGGRRGCAAGVGQDGLEGLGSDDDDGQGGKGRRYGNRSRKSGDDDNGEGDGKGGSALHGRRSRRGSLADDGQGKGHGSLNSKSNTSGYPSDGEDAEGRYGGKGGHFGRRIPRRSSKVEEALKQSSGEFSRNLELENIRDLFTRPWSFSYFPGGVDVESDDED